MELREKITRYIEGLDERIRHLISLFREQHPFADITDVVEESRTHGDTLRARTRPSRKDPLLPKSKDAAQSMKVRKPSVHFADEEEDVEAD